MEQLDQLHSCIYKYASFSASSRMPQLPDRALFTTADAITLLKVIICVGVLWPTARVLKNTMSCAFGYEMIAHKSYSLAHSLLFSLCSLVLSLASIGIRK
jgi:hypothetical protein